MRLALLQPVAAPNLYDLAVMLQADRILLQDEVRWSRKGRVHRWLIRTPDGRDYLSIPIHTDDRRKPIRQVRIDQESNWLTPLLRSLRYNYRGSRYFDFYGPEVEADLHRVSELDYLLPAALHLRERLFHYLDLDEELEQKERLVSEVGRLPEDPDKLAFGMGADVLYQEHRSRHYQRQAEMRTDPVFEHPVYHQHFEGFELWCSLYDLLFQCGPESFYVIDSLRAGSGGQSPEENNRSEQGGE